MKLAWTIQNIWESYSKLRLGFTVAHCQEISPENQNILRMLTPYIQILDICDINQLQGRRSIFGMNIRQAKKRLRGFHCKVAALIMSPFPETILMDVDVVFFKSPYLLFNAPAYRETGTLFFRDRVTFKHLDGNGGVDIGDLRIFFGKYGLEINATSTHTLLRENGVSLFWHYGLRNDSVMQDYQDSSVVLLNKPMHPIMLQVLEQHLPDFFIGFGDKEMYWIAATVAREPFAFEPHLTGQYGDCAGFIIHFDPTHVPFLEYRNASYPSLLLSNSSSSKLDGITTHRPAHGVLRGGSYHAEPFYCNAEHMVEKGLQFLGQYLSDTITVPVLVNAQNIDDLISNNRIAHFQTWMGKRGNRNCTCDYRSRYSCQPVHTIVNAHLVLAGWITITARIHENEKNSFLAEKVETRLCVPTLVKNAPLLEFVFTRLLKDLVAAGDCFFVGCPSVPVTVNASLPWSPISELDPEGAEYCEPFTYSFASFARNLSLPSVSRGSDALSAEELLVLNRSKMALSESQSLKTPFSIALQLLAEEARRPLSLWIRPDFPDGQLLQADNSRSVFMMRNGSLHGFAGMKTVRPIQFFFFFS